MAGRLKSGEMQTHFGAHIYFLELALCTRRDYATQLSTTMVGQGPELFPRSLTLTGYFHHRVTPAISVLVDLNPFHFILVCYLLEDQFLCGVFAFLPILGT
jgi:hypothetical protein